MSVESFLKRTKRAKHASQSAISFCSILHACGICLLTSHEIHLSNFPRTQLALVRIGWRAIAFVFIYQIHRNKIIFFAILTVMGRYKYNEGNSIRKCFADVCNLIVYYAQASIFLTFITPLTMHNVSRQMLPINYNRFLHSWDS